MSILLRLYGPWINEAAAWKITDDDDDDDDYNYDYQGRSQPINL